MVRSLTNPLVLNFGHPLSDAAQAELVESIGEFETVLARVSLDMDSPLEPQLVAVVEGMEVSSEAFQTRSLVVVLPGASVAAGIVLAMLHGRSGNWPKIMHLVRADDGVFHVGELVDLQRTRNTARTSR